MLSWSLLFVYSSGDARLRRHHTARSVSQRRHTPVQLQRCECVQRHVSTGQQQGGAEGLLRHCGLRGHCPGILYGASQRKVSNCNYVLILLLIWDRSISWARERYVCETRLGHGTQGIGSLRGVSGHIHNPFAGI